MVLLNGWKIFRELFFCSRKWAFYNRSFPTPWPYIWTGHISDIEKALACMLFLTQVDGYCFWITLRWCYLFDLTFCEVRLARCGCTLLSMCCCSRLDVPGQVALPQACVGVPNISARQKRRLRMKEEVYPPQAMARRSSKKQDHGIYFIFLLRIFESLNRRGAPTVIFVLLCF